MPPAPVVPPPTPPASFDPEEQAETDNVIAETSTHSKLARMIAPSYREISGRRNAHTRRCGCEASMWHRQIQAPLFRCSINAAGCGSWIITRSPLRSRVDAFR